MLIGVFAWKGTWDLLDTGVDSFVGPNKKLKSLTLTLIIGYALYIFLIILEKILKRIKCLSIPENKKFRMVTEDLVYLVAYFAMIAVWRTFWSGYDYFVLPSPYRVYIIFGTHCLAFIILVLFKLGSSVYGPAGTSAQPTTTTIATNAAPFKFSLFDIEYFYPPKFR